tara:strand:- start:273 stop:542 length:270 start_codon:yes stop_codon:yes gene_type:complete
MGGPTDLPAFNTFIRLLVGGDQTFIQENISVLANTPVTINHNLNEKLVVPKIYSYPGGELRALYVQLIDENSLTISSSGPATVSIIVKA